MSINRVLISGNLTRDPEMRSTAGGTAVLKLGVAVNDRRKNASTGEWENVPNYVDVIVFGKRGEWLARNVGKGDKIAIEGKLRYSSWEAADGGKRNKLEVVADEFELLSGEKKRADVVDELRDAFPGADIRVLDAPAPNFQDDEIPF